MREWQKMFENERMALGAKVLLCQPCLPLHLHDAAHRLRSTRLFLAVQAQSEITIWMRSVIYCLYLTLSPNSAALPDQNG